MKYTKGRIGRVFVLKFDNGDVVLRELERFCREQKVSCGVCQFIGALNSGDMAAGPKKPVMPPTPNWLSFRDGWETMAIATIFPGPTGPQLHVHASLGKGKRVLTGCVRRDSNVFGVLEAVVFELTGVDARKEADPATGINMLAVGPRGKGRRR